MTPPFAGTVSQELVIRNVHRYRSSIRVGGQTIGEYGIKIVAEFR
jgi:hypothetical protein